MLAQKISGLRKAHHMTQEMAAAEFGVSRQSVQKWESGASVPEIGKLVEMAKYFGVSLDFLILDSADGAKPCPSADKKCAPRELRPSFEDMHEWENYSRNMDTEFTQSMEEGRDVEPLRGLCAEIAKLPDNADKDALADTVFRMLQSAPQREDYPHFEPSDYETIHRLAKHSAPRAVKRPLKNAVLGAWVGRICGCLLGKPVEGMRMDELMPFLHQIGNYPMHRYLMDADITEERIQMYTHELHNRWCADTISCAPPDDDTNYVVLACLLVEKYGRSFTPRNVADLWISCQSRDAYCTAERVAFRNFVAGYLPPDSAVYKNPYREWIGAQIRGDFFGYINPGNPEAAAEMAYRDACISHVKNGIYGEMWAAAMIAAAAVSSDMEEVIEAGLNEVPASSRLHKMVTDVLESYRAGKTMDETLKELLYSRYYDRNNHYWCHTLTNAMIVAAALLYGEKDYGKSICLAVQSGFDTDCNGATVGSVVGMMIGEENIPSYWKDVVKGRLETTVFGVGTVKIEEMAERTLKCMPQ